MDAPKRLLESSSLSPDARRLLESYDPTPHIPEPVAVDVAERLVELPAAGGGFAVKAGLAVLTVLGGGALWLAASTGAFELDGAAAETPSALVAPAGEHGADGVKAAGAEGVAEADAVGDLGDARRFAGVAGGDLGAARKFADGARGDRADATNFTDGAGSDRAGATKSAGVAGGDVAGATKSAGDAGGDVAGATKSAGDAGDDRADATKSAGDAGDDVADARRSVRAARDDGASATKSASAGRTDLADAKKSASAKRTDLAGAKKSGGLAEELRILDAGKRALAASPSTALEQVRLHRDVFPNGQLADLRDFLEIRAYEGIGSSDRAGRLREAFLQNHPDSALVRELK